ncbi:MAG: LytTR family DNA-binding domain-containing protein [Bacteroidota bacterium]
MVNSLLIESEKEALTSLEDMIDNYCPQISICGKAHSIPTAFELITDINPELVFIDVSLLLKNGICIVDQFTSVSYEFILVSDFSKYAIDAIKCSAAGYVIKPVKKEDLLIAVANAHNRITIKAEYANNKFLAERYFRQSNNEDVIGIPTIEGFEFIPIKDILRFEGLQKCTRVITKDKSDIVSSYNIGEFRKLLRDFSFFSPHKSHLINLSYIRKYHREGSIKMVDGSFVPVAKRKKGEFLEKIKHI